MVGYIEKPTVSRESDKFMLRLPDGMRDLIRKMAEANHRSMNAEIVAALESWSASWEYLNQQAEELRQGDDLQDSAGLEDMEEFDLQLGEQVATFRIVPGSIKRKSKNAPGKGK